MKIAVTGITGFIGKKLALKLLKEGHEVCGLVHSEQKALLLPNNIKKFFGDIRSKTSVKKAIEGCELVYHCAAVVNGNRKTMMSVNVQGTETICEAARQLNIKKMIYISSVAVISGNEGLHPLKEDAPYSAYNDYGRSKIEAEKVVRKFIQNGVNIAVIRPSAVYGPDEPHALSYFFRLSKIGIMPIVGSGTTKWQLIHIEDLTDFLISIIGNKLAYNNIFNISSDEAVEIIQLYRLVRTLTNRGIIIHIPFRLIFPFAVLADIPFTIVGKAPFTNRVRFFEINHIYDLSKAKNILGFKTKIALRNGLSETYLHWKKS